MCSRKSLVDRELLTVGDMAPELIDRIIFEIKRMVKAGKRVRFIPMGLGEPLLFPGLFDLFRRLRAIEKNIKIDLVTNGALINEHIIHEIFASDIDSVSVSLKLCASFGGLE
jgi:Predicted Fe-S oxidoreductases